MFPVFITIFKCVAIPLFLPLQCINPPQGGSVNKPTEAELPEESVTLN